jgi:hypothetical protein
MADNSYALEIKIVSKSGYHTPAEALAYYKKYSRVGITWHWWNAPHLVNDNAHDTIVKYISQKALNGTGSVNYVLSNLKISLLVNPDNVAWASQAGNPTTISVELSPHLNAEGYKKAGWLADQLRQRYSRTMLHYKHSDWFTTQCPGTISIDRIKQEAEKWRTGVYDKVAPAPTPAPAPQPAPAPTPQPTVGFVWTPYPSGETKTHKANKATYLYNVNAGSWPEIKKVTPYVKGETVEIYGTVLNQKLNATYLITKSAYDTRSTVGFSQADWDRVVAPVTVPTPPTPVPDKPATYEPTPYDIEQDKRLSAIEAFINAIKKLFTGVN